MAKQKETSNIAVSDQELHSLFDIYTQQLNTAKAHLQQISELILLKQISVQNPTKTNSSIKEIQEQIDHLISFIDSNYTLESIIKLSYISSSIITYLKETAESSIEKLNTKDMNAFIAKEIQNQKKENDFDHIINKNQANLKSLGLICDNVGLSSFSQTYRYLSKNNVFWAARQAAFWGSIAGIVGLYYIWDSQVRTLPGTNELVLNTDERYLKMIERGVAPQERLGVDVLPKIQPGKDGSTKTLIDTIKEWADIKTWIDTQKTSSYLDWLRISIHEKTNFDLRNHLPAAVLSGVLINPLQKNIIDFINNTWTDVSKLAQEGSDALDKHLKGEKQKMHNAFNQASYKRVYFTDMVNGEHLEKIVDEYVDYINNPERYDRTGTAPCKGILLVGPPQTGKSLFANAFLTAIEDRCEKFSNSYKFFPYTASEIALRGLSVEQIFYNAYQNAPAVIFFDEIDMMGMSREQNNLGTSAFLTQMSGLMSEHPEKHVFVIAATNKPERLDFALLQKGRLGRIIPFEYPPVNARKTFIEKQLAKRSVEFSQSFVTQLAKETEGLSYNAISEIITEALRSAKQQMRLIKEQDLWDSFDKHTRKIAPYAHKEYTADDKKYIATYQAGKAIAIKALQANTNIAKVTILPVIKNINTENVWEGLLTKEKDKNIEHENPFTKESYQFGSVFTYHAEESLGLKNTADLENEYIALIAGSVAQELLFKNTSLTLFKDDYSKANALLYELTQNEYFSKEDREKAMKAIEKTLREKARSLLQEHILAIKNIQQALIERNTIDETMFTKLYA